MRKRRTASLAFAGVSMFALAAALPVVAAEVTPERLINANKEPHNWLMNHRTYDAQRFSPLDAINEGNVKGLRLAYAVALGNSAGKEYNEATALAEDGFLYITDSWGVLYKIDVTSGDAGRRPGYYGLSAAATRFGVPVEQTHHALDDAFMTAELFLVAANALEARGRGSIRDLLRITARG